MFQKSEMVKYKNIVESFFDRKCSIYEYIEVKDGCVSRYKCEKVLEDIPCRRSYDAGSGLNYNKTGEESTDNLEEKQFVRLFLPVGTQVKTGSRIELNNGECYEYSGISLVYDTHIEVYARNVQRWA